MKLDSCWPFIFLMCKTTWKFLVESQFIIKPCTPNLAVFFEQKGLSQKVGYLHSQYFPISNQYCICLGVFRGLHMSQIIAASSDKSVMISQVTELRLSRILNQNMSQKQWVLWILLFWGLPKIQCFYCLKFHPYTSVVPKLASPLPLGCKSWPA